MLSTELQADEVLNKRSAPANHSWRSIRIFELHCAALASAKKEVTAPLVLSMPAPRATDRRGPIMATSHGPTLLVDSRVLAGPAIDDVMAC
jgi:hypothetical protein